jgi:hypothetical protein
MSKARNLIRIAMMAVWPNGVPLDEFEKVIGLIEALTVSAISEGKLKAPSRAPHGALRKLPKTPKPPRQGPRQNHRNRGVLESIRRTLENGPADTSTLAKASGSKNKLAAGSGARKLGARVNVDGLYELKNGAT